VKIQSKTGGMLSGNPADNTACSQLILSGANARMERQAVEISRGTSYPIVFFKLGQANHHLFRKPDNNNVDCS